MENWLLVLIGFGAGTALALLIYLVTYVRNYLNQKRLHQRSLVKEYQKPVISRQDEAFSSQDQSSMPSNEWEVNARKRYFEQGEEWIKETSTVKQESDLYDVNVESTRFNL